MQWLHGSDVLLGHPIPPVGLGDGTVASKHGERRGGGGVPQVEPHFLPPINGFRHGDVEIRIDTLPRLDTDDHNPRISHFRARALREPNAKEVVPQDEMGVNPHEGLA
jgi:hypothetical protein